MSGRVILATAIRVLRQISRDRRTMALILLVPTVLLALFRWVYDQEPAAFLHVGPPLVGIFPLTMMFLITSIAMLRERVNGTLERLMSMPASKVDLLLGYGVGFALVAAVQASVTAAVAFGLLGLTSNGPVWAVVLLAVGNAILGMALGLFVSAFARTEFQAIQFMPAVLMPQFLLAGLFAPRDHMARALELVSDVLPVTYAFDALTKVTTRGLEAPGLARDIAIIAGATLLALLLAAATLRRRTE